MVRPRLLDLFSGQGGCGEGYARAGFDVVGVDLAPQPRYPYAFWQADALAYVREHGHRFDVIHASPPCQRYSAGTRASGTRDRHPDLLAPTREALRATGLPYVIENVREAPMPDALVLCGASFGLTATDDDGTPLVLRRHRQFESNTWLWPRECECPLYKDRGFVIGGVYGGGSSTLERARTVRNGGYTPPDHVQRRLMRIDWMTRNGLRQAIPPAYTEYLGRQLLEAIR